MIILLFITFMIQFVSAEIPVMKNEEKIKRAKQNIDYLYNKLDEALDYSDVTIIMYENGKLYKKYNYQKLKGKDDNNIKYSFD